MDRGPRTGVRPMAVVGASTFPLQPALADGLGGLRAMSGLAIVYPLLILALICIPVWLWYSVRFLRSRRRRTPGVVVVYLFCALVCCAALPFAVLLGYFASAPGIANLGVIAIMVVSIAALTLPQTS